MASQSFGPEQLVHQCFMMPQHLVIFGDEQTSKTNIGQLLQLLVLKIVCYIIKAYMKCQAVFQHILNFSNLSELSYRWVVIICQG